MSYSMAMVYHSNVARGLPQIPKTKRPQGMNSFDRGSTRCSAIAWGEGSNFELGPSGTNQLILKIEEPIELLLYL